MVSSVSFTNDMELARAAIRSRGNAYVPYSGFKVGAALLTAGGKIYTGCNIENAAFTPTVCAERAAFIKAVSEGEREFAAIAVAGWKDGASEKGFAYPCGVCRQVMMEFCDPGNFRIIVASEGNKLESYLLGQLLPCGFGPSNL